MTVIRSPIRPVIFSPIRQPTTLYKGGGFRGPAIFLLAGQSNMVGGNIAWDSGADYPEGTLQWGRYGADDGQLVACVGGEPMQHWDIDELGSFPNNGMMGLYIQFAIDFHARTGRQVVFVPAAKGNSGFANGWTPGAGGTADDLYDDAVARTNACIAAVPEGRFEGILWHQGEYEASAQNPSAHRANLINLIDAFRTNITGATDNTLFVLGGLLPEFVTSGGYASTQTMLEGFPEYVAYTAFASSADTTSSDGVHFDAASLRTMGTRYEAAWRAARANIAEPPSVVQNLDATPDDTEMHLAWDAPADIGGRPITDYVVRYRETGDTDWITFSDGTSTTTSATVTGLTNGTSYDFQVAAINAAGEGAAATDTNTPAVQVTPLVILERGSDGFEVNAASHTFTDVAVETGTVIVFIVNGNFNTPSAVTIDGQTATEIGSSGVVGNHCRAAWIAEGVTGPVADVAITFTGSTGGVAIVAVTLPATVVAADCTFYSDSVQSDSGDSPPFTFELDAAVSNGGAVLGFAGGYIGSTAAISWTGVTESVTEVKIGGGTGAGWWYGLADHIATADEAARAIAASYNTTAAGSGLAVVVVDP